LYERSHNSGKSNAKDLVKNMLKELHLKGVGPAPKFDIEFGDRLNILTGDNGLGKSFILDVAWFALTEEWASNSALPKRDLDEPPNLSSIYLSNPDSSEAIIRIYEFNSNLQTWNLSSSPFNHSPGFSKPFLLAYSRVDGRFSIREPFRHPFTMSRHGVVLQSSFIAHFTVDALWNGLRDDAGKVICNGLIQDWVTWQYQPDRGMFELLSRVVATLSHPNESIEIGKPSRIDIDDAREIPTINLPYGNVPVTHASAGMQRILTLAYMLVWSWHEHIEVSKLVKKDPADKLILLIDEIESHLHPQWQRSILPAVLEVAKILQPEMQIQVIATTHSPLVLASLEPYFEEARDKLFLFKLNGAEVTLGEVPWTKQGDADNWLTSKIFELKQPQSKEAENAIEAAYTLMRGEDMKNFPEHLRSQEQIHQELLKVLTDHDSFWRRWVVTAE
jgi:AAA domain, putative AbiEii toxin, Type IV TA system/AAA domain